MDNKKRFKTMIGKKAYTFIGTASDEHMRSVSKILNDELNSLKNQSENISDEDAAILIAFNAVSNQLDKQLELDQLKNKMKDEDL
ncbi:cell division protein ZapA [Fructilactobacillus lindneri]|uniref:cell division protein ZapA n=1 Tax=Fructilactobacillus lindneri TaxID=53444 RepID=UPI0009CFC41B|nr:cell division protein ZapA [Fructilactobacillus lindneri]SJZ73648.1 cell division protein ZapA [Fructilactobacillus lindneri DSM 20690 = JCM 11027]